MKALLGSLVFILSFNSLAIDKESYRVSPGETRVVIEIDGKFKSQTQTDVLFVVDDSGSMGMHQENLANHVQIIAAEALRAKNDFHIGVTSTSDRVFGVQEKVGQLLGNPTIITSSTPDLVSTIQNNILIGTQGDPTETMFTPVLEALSEEMMNGMNKGFYREEAHLALVFLTDTDDQSEMSASDFINSLRKIKRTDKMSLHSIMVRSDDKINKTCRGETDTGLPGKIEEAVYMLGGKTFSLCSNQMTQNIGTLATDIFDDIKGKHFPQIKIDFLDLEIEPAGIGRMEVRYGKQRLRNSKWGDYYYDHDQKRVIFSPDIKWQRQPEGTKIVVSYIPAIK